MLGNGLNRIDNSYSWEHLMLDLLAHANLVGAISMRNKPFPMLYEELYLRYIAADPSHREMDLKKKIKGLMKQIEANDLHHEVMELPISEIITTNYDHNLEATLPRGLKGAPYIQPVKGSKYHMLRRRQAGDKVIWHIHGEATKPGTILLGYEPYSGFLSRIRTYFNSSLTYRDKDKETGEFLVTTLPALMPRIAAEEHEVHSWVDHFFFSDLYIVGLSMDFVEMHLWWILHFRARLQTDVKYPINNNIYFLYPSVDQTWIKSRIDLLCACGVKCIQVPVQRRNWKAAYQSAIGLIRNSAEANGLPVHK